jgi:uncharacterized protein (DUF924 family)
MVTPDEVLDWWIGEIGPAGWYSGASEIDEIARQKFGAAHAMAMEGGLGLWLTDSRGCLAYLILTDQLSRNMFRGTAAAFAADPMAREVAKGAIEKDFDLAVPAPERQFFYLPLEHSEDLADQDRAVALFRDRMGGDAAELSLHARAHRRVIRKFGRFPMRNEALGRATTAEEQRWLDQGAYGAEVRALRAEAQDKA